MGSKTVMFPGLCTPELGQKLTLFIFLCLWKLPLHRGFELDALWDPQCITAGGRMGRGGFEVHTTAGGRGLT